MPQRTPHYPGACRQTGIYMVPEGKKGMKFVQGRQRVVEDYPDYLKDESNVQGDNASGIFFPRSIENIVYAVNCSRKEKMPLTVSGGRTGICAGAVPEGGYVLSLEKMKRVLGLENRYGNWEVQVEAGVRLSELAEKLRSKDLGLKGEAARQFKKDKNSYFYPPDPTEITAAVGGTAATNASGARSFYYGPTREYVVGLEVVLSTGEVLRIRRGEVKEQDGYLKINKQKGSPLWIKVPGYRMPGTKNSAGLYAKKSMDLIDLFIGSEGILGIIASVTLKLLKEPGLIIAGAGFFSDEKHAVDFVCRARGDRAVEGLQHRGTSSHPSVLSSRSREGKLRPMALEYFDSGSLEVLEQERRAQGPTSEIPALPSFGGAVYFESEAETEHRMKECLREWKTMIHASGGDSSTSWCAVNKRDQQRLKAVRHALPESINRTIAEKKKLDGRIHKVGTDTAVPDRHLVQIMRFYRELLEKERFRYVIFGHIGDNHLHVNMIPSTYRELERAKQIYTQIAARSVNLGGTVSAEHGVGKLKKEYLALQYSGSRLDEMRKVKQALDPSGLLNPGRVIE
ncbi:MAG: FAD-binding oxidoreductase [Spirochaetota bacterium]